MVTEIGVAQFKQAIPQPDTFLRILMFFGATCGPCKATMPHYEAVSEFFQARRAKILFFKINAWEPEENSKYCNEVWQIQGVPNFKAFYNGEVVFERSGGGDEEIMKKFITDSIDAVFKKFGVKI